MNLVKDLLAWPIFVHLIQVFYALLSLDFERLDLVCQHMPSSHQRVLLHELVNDLLVRGLHEHDQTVDRKLLSSHNPQVASRLVFLYELRVLSSGHH